MRTRTRLVWTLILLAAAAGLANAAIQSKLPADIAGDYLLDFGGQTRPFKMTIQSDKLFFDALIQGGTAQPMTPVEGKALTFKGVDPNNDELILVFTQDAKGKITGCTVSLPGRGIEATAAKVEAK